MSRKQQNKRTGALGEALATEFLKGKGMAIINRNYLKPYGEIDIVARGTAGIHFVEVKTVSYETKADLERAVINQTWRPEEMVHNHKLGQLNKVIQAWLSEYRHTGAFQIDVVTVRIVPRETYCTANYIENIQAN
jgi:putative endonuclease